MDKIDKGLRVAIIALLIVLIVVVFLIKGSFNSKEEYIITFDSDGGSIVQTQYVLEDRNVIIPKDPFKEGYDFDGWYLNDKEYNFDSKVTGDVKLIAKWKVAEEYEDLTRYTITFNTDGAESIKDKKVWEEQKIGELPTITKSGYRFNGWYINDKKVTSDYIVTKNITVTAKWTKLYTVTFNSDGGSTVNKQEVAEGEKVVKVSNPKKSGYVFDGWYLDGKKYSFDSKVSKNLELTAKWAKAYTITFNSDGGSKVSTLSVKQNTVATKPSNPTKSGYKFDGWYLGNEKYQFTEKVSKDITLTAKWIKVINVESLKISNTTLKLEKGKTSTLTVEITPDNATNKTITWTSSNSKVASVSKTGKVTALSKGTATITATVDGKKVTCKVTVTAPITYSIEWEQIQSSSIGQYRLYIKSSEGNYVSGKIEYETIDGDKGTEDVSKSGIVFVKSVIKTVKILSAN